MKVIAEAFPQPRFGPKRTDMLTSMVSRLHHLLECKYQGSLTSEVQAALSEFDRALAKRDSISRKHCGESSAFDATDLAHCEHSLAKAKEVLVQLASDAPILQRHPVIGPIVSHAQAPHIG